MHIDKYKTADGYEDDEGCFHDSAVSFYQSYFFGFCGCGCSENNIRYIRDGLQYIEALMHGPNDREERHKWWVAMQVKGDGIFGNERSKYFFYYWADTKGLTEHGGAVPGWLTNKGEMVLQDLVQIVEEMDKEETQV